MPPKGHRPKRGARGGARGGAAVAGRETDSTSEAIETTTPPTFDAPPTIEHTTAVVPKEEGDIDAKPPTPTENDSTPIDTSSAAATPQDGAEASVRPPVQRLGGLKSAEPSSRSASPSVKRGTTTKSGKSAAPKPMFTGRRSNEDRAALEKEQLEREKIRNRDQEREAQFQAKRKERDAAREASRATRGRGGYSGAMSGPFSLGSSKEGR